jgi:hypothetical protein
MLVVGHYFVCVVLEYFGGKFAHDGAGLDMEVSHHDVRLPAADELDVVIDLCAQE